MSSPREQTDAVNSLIKSTISNFSEQKRGTISKIQVDWKEVGQYHAGDVFSTVCTPEIVPTLLIEFFK